MTPFSREQWVSGTRSGCSMWSSSSPTTARHLVPTCPHTPSSPKGQAAGPTALLSAMLFPPSHTLLKEGIVCTKGRTRVAHYKSELLSDKWAMKSILTSWRCSRTCSLLSLIRVQQCEDRTTGRVTTDWLEGPQIVSFQPQEVWLARVWQWETQACWRNS